MVPIKQGLPDFYKEEVIIRSGLMRKKVHRWDNRLHRNRDVAGAGWPPPEVAENVNTTEMGNLGLSRGEENAIVMFLKTLSDGWTPK